MPRTLSSLYCRRNLGVRGSEKPGDLFAQLLVGGHARELALPQVEVTPRQPVIIGIATGFGIVAVGRHVRSITQDP
jgi:hypothetical protein